jgi:hypothetical protein
MYLYVDEALDLARVPEALLAQFGRPERVMGLVLNADRNLATEDVATVMRNIRNNGYHLQMPPVAEFTHRDMHNHKKPRS